MVFVGRKVDNVKETGLVVVLLMFDTSGLAVLFPFVAKTNPASKTTKKSIIALIDLLKEMYSTYILVKAVYEAPNKWQEARYKFL